MSLRRPKASRRGGVALDLGLASLGPAGATPPDIVNVSDEVFALGKGAVLVLHEPIAGAVNPYDILQELRARPLSWQGDFDLPPGALHEQDGMVSVSYGDGLTYRRPLQEMLDSLAASQAALAQDIPDYTRFGPLGLGDLLSGRQFTVAQCSIADPTRLDDRSGAPPVVLVRFRCEEESDGQSSALLLPLLLTR